MHFLAILGPRRHEQMELPPGLTAVGTNPPNGNPFVRLDDALVAAWQLLLCRQPDGGLRVQNLGEAPVHVAGRLVGQNEDCLVTFPCHLRVGQSHLFAYQVMDAPGGQTEGFYAMGVIDPLYRDTATPEVAAWMDKYKARFDTEASIAAALGYVIMDTTIHALDRAGPTLTTETLVKAIEGIHGYRDIFNGPSIDFGPDRHVGSTKAILYQVRQGRWKRTTDPLGF